jgi:hypothetical protein
MRSDVLELKDDYLEMLLNLQEEIDANVITIPNIFENWDYNNAINFSYKWKKNEGIDKPLMAIACNENHAKTINKNLDKINGIGINLKRNNPPLLYYIRNNLKQNNIWIHGFMAPRTYRSIKFKGTLGILINFFGIDTISPFVAPPETSRMFKLITDKQLPEEKEQKAGENKYFNPLDYGRYDFNNLEENFGSNYSLSNFCPCEICENNTIEEITSDYEFTFIHTRAHDVFANIIEAHKFNESIEEEMSSNYIDEKNFAKLILNKLKLK